MRSNSLSVKRIALLSILTALCFVGRIFFQFIPNVQPMTAVLLIIALNFGIFDGLIVTTGSILLSNIFLGMGPWTIFQIAAYFIIILIAGMLRPIYKNKSMVSKFFFVFFAFLSGVIYGFVISIFSVQLYGMPNFWIYYAQGLPFDLAHALGNAGFFIILDPVIGPLLRKRYNYYLD